MTSRKIFCVTLPRSGTRTLVEASKLLGLRSFHNPARLWSQHFVGVSPPYTKDNTWDMVALFGFFEVKQLAKAYPDAVFLYRCRDLEPWLESWRWGILDHPKNMKRWQQHRRQQNFPPQAFDYLFGRDTINFDEAKWKHVWTTHRKYMVDICQEVNVRHYDLTWDSLCGALDMEIPDKPFPHVVGKARQTFKANKRKG